MEIEGFHGLKAYISFFYELNMSLIARLIITETTLGIPIGTYAFLEFFCVDPDRDCRKTSII